MNDYNFNRQFQQPLTLPQGGNTTGMMDYGFQSVLNPETSFSNQSVNPNQFTQGMDGWGVGIPDQMQLGVDVKQLMPDFNNWQKAGVGIQGASALLSGIMGMKQYGLAKDQFKFQKDSFNKNYANQVQTTNTELEDRQRRRLAGGGGGGVSLEEYMNKNRIQ